MHVTAFQRGNGQSHRSIKSYLSLRDPVRVVFPQWVEAIFIKVDKIATQ
jgi:hypothetical protein